jgi:YHS domain-containing protein
VGRRAAAPLDMIARLLLYPLLAVLLITLLRYVIGSIGRAFSEFVAPQHTREAAGRAQPVGELKKDPVCGTYVAVTASVKKTVGGEVIHFCSAACRDRYRTGSSTV